MFDANLRCRVVSYSTNSDEFNEIKGHRYVMKKKGKRESVKLGLSACSVLITVPFSMCLLGNGTQHIRNILYRMVENRLF